jgi:hypothetical protein
MSAFTYIEKTTSAKKNSGRKSALTEKDHRTSRRMFKKNHRTTAAQVTAELNIRFEDPVSTKTVRRDLRKTNFHCRAAISKSQITESNAHMRKRRYHDRKTWTSDNWKLARDVVK